MSLPPVILDDLTWADLTASSRRRIPAASRGSWTLHAPVDPGVTLLELHAWLLEQRLYWMAQVPDTMVRGALALLGDAANDAACAATVLHFPAGDGDVPAGTAMQMQDSVPPLIFTTEAGTRVLPLAAAPGGTIRPRIDLRVDGAEHGPDLIAGKPVCLFESGEAVAVTLWLRPMPMRSMPMRSMQAGQDATLLVLLDQPGAPAAWDADAVDDIAPPARISWWYAGSGGAKLPLANVQDGTGGLRRSGIVRFSLPPDWMAGIADPHGNRPFTLWLRADTAGFTAPPRLVGLWPNVAVARHRRDRVVRHQLDWLKLPGNTIALAPDELRPLMDGTRLRLNESQGWRWWRPTADLAFHGPRDRVFVIDRDLGALRFGNGETGRIPVPADRFTLRDLADPARLVAAWQSADALSVALRPTFPAGAVSRILAATAATSRTRPVLRALLASLNALLALAQLGEMLRAPKAGTPAQAANARVNRRMLEDAYPKALALGQAELHLRVGGGRVGNVGAWRRWEPVGAQPAPSAINVVAGQGGADPESLAAARERSAGKLRRVERAVLADDFEALARSTRGIARARAAIGVHPDFPCLPVPGVVTVFVVPAAPRDEDPSCGIVSAPCPDGGALATVAERLDAARLLGTEVFVRPPIYQPVVLTLSVQASSATPDALRGAIATRLGRFLDPLTGGEDGDGWPFGEKLRPSVLLRQAQDAIADAGDVVEVIISLPEGKPPVVGESCRDVEIGAHALPALRHVAIRIGAPKLPTGGLT